MSTLVEKRLAICEKCGLYKETQFGPVCNSSKYKADVYTPTYRYINKEGKTSFLPKEGYVKGCSCLVEKKAANVDSHCVAGFW